jgi:hypothetical protein
MEGKLPENILLFVRTLRAAGLRLGPASAVAAVKAVEAAGIGNRDDFYWVLHATLVSRHEDTPVFDEAFRLYWRPREYVEKLLQMFSPMAVEKREREKPRAGQSRVSEALYSGKRREQADDRPQIEIDARMTASEKEILRARDFAQMSAAEMALARLAIRDLVLPVRPLRTRRFAPSARPAQWDPRRMIAASLRSGGDLLLPKFRNRRLVEPPVVALADISGSMSQYSRIFLHFLHALMEDRRRVHTFLFGTRLTNVTRALRRKDPDQALADCSRAVADWSGGTRIASTLGEFNRLWSRRVLGQGAIVLLITDGLEREPGDDLARQMDRLRRSCRRLIWLNPLLRFDGFEARARGVRQMLPHVDEFRAVHSLDALSDLCASLARPAARGEDPKSWLKRVA